MLSEALKKRKTQKQVKYQIFVIAVSSPPGAVGRKEGGHRQGGGAAATAPLATLATNVRN